MANCLESADKLIHGPRRAAYGPVEESFNRVAKMWSAILNTDVTPYQVALMMVAFKVAREANSHTQDNLDDICGYTALLEELYAKNPVQSFMDSEAAAKLGDS